jgi:leader peptidase (prepilin peptidase) / N-methyltransferase
MPVYSGDRKYPGNGAVMFNASRFAMFSLSILQYQNYPLLFVCIAIIAFAMGASIGSFLNVVIYRIPLGLSVNEPRRSFCPTCKYQIPWYCNLPLISWVSLRGKCANCKGEISPRYIIVEFITGLVFFLAVLKFPFPVVIVYWVMLSLFIATIYIDIDHYIIPNQITLGGMVAAIVFAGIFPAMFFNPVEIAEKGPAMSRVWSVGQSVLGAVCGYALLWMVVELGKLAFGKKKEVFDKPVAFKIHEVSYETGECEPVLFYENNEEEPAGDVASTEAKEQPGKEGGDTPGWEKQPWSDMFYRSTDKLIMTCDQVVIDGKDYSNVELVLFETRLEVRSGADSAATVLAAVELENIEEIEGSCTQVVIPREAMGMGDVKFMAMSGAFLGGWSTLFTLVSASIFGSVVALSMAVLGKREWAARLPFGPYLVFGSTLWLFYGKELVDWYWNLAGGK